MFGASDGIQTRGLFLGKEALYQLSYTRISSNEYENYIVLRCYNQVFVVVHVMSATSSSLILSKYSLGVK